MNQKTGPLQKHSPLYSAAPSQIPAHLVEGCLQAIFPEQTQRSSRIIKRSFRLFSEIRDEPKKRPLQNPQPPLQRSTISNFCSPCGRLLAGDLSRANAAQQSHKKKVLQAFPDIRDEPKKRAASKAPLLTQALARSD